MLPCAFFPLSPIPYFRRNPERASQAVSPSETEILIFYCIAVPIPHGLPRPFCLYFRLYCDGQQMTFQSRTGCRPFSKHSYYNLLLKTVSTACDLFAITAEELSL